MTKPNTFLETYTGLRPVIGDMKPDQVCLGDISTSLSRLVRFIGHTERAYSVGEHCILVSRLLEHHGCHPLIQLAGLMHDAHEAYIGDMPTPVKIALGASEAWGELEANADLAICQWTEILVPDDFHLEEVKRADIGALMHEAKYLCHSKGEGWGYTLDNVYQVPPHIERESLGRKPWLVKTEFVSRYLQLKETLREHASDER